MKAKEAASVAGLKSLEFELAYLSLLTHAGVKPLSRWEKGFDRNTIEALHALGLNTGVVERTVQSGQRLHELLFSASSQCIEAYVRRFDHSPIDHCRDHARLEGLWFGYPSCCVESYVERGYARNMLRRCDQRILFHWACPHCALTPLLLPEYRCLHHECTRLMRGSIRPRWPQQRLVVHGHLRRAIAMAASVMALGGGAFLPQPAAGAPDPLDPHLIALPSTDDSDHDFLPSSEEAILGLDPFVFDQNGNAIPDGVDLANQFSLAIDALPTKPSATQPYVVHHLTFGLETCQICSTQINMGFLEVINPLENQTSAIPCVAKHFLEHGSFSYQGSIHSGRINPSVLKLVLHSTGQGHFMPEPKGTDADGDGLRQWEEAALGMDPEKPDTDGDAVLDGIDLAREWRALLDTLPRKVQPDRPYVVEHPMDGYEVCPRCGERVVMDLWEVIHPVTGDMITLPSMALHFMTHGGFGWHGGQLLGGQGRIDPRQLQAVLTGRPNPHLVEVTPDRDRDQLTDGEEKELGKDPANADEDRNTVRDGLDLARSVAGEIAGLPAKPDATAVYRLDFPVKGLELCERCGASLNMGHVTICNPLAQLYAPISYLALHGLEHDSFSFAGNVHGTGRTDVKLLIETLHSNGPSHRVAVPGDADADGLKDFEERHFETDPALTDTHLDGVPDGFALAYGMWGEVDALPRLASPGSTPPTGSPYAIDHMLRGVVACPVCGVWVNMGWVEVVNPREGRAMNLPYLALHFMRHGSFASSPQERINPCLLDVLLHGQGTAHLINIAGDTDGDGLLDNEEPHFGTLPGTPDSDGDGIRDGVALARRMHERLMTLATGTSPSDIAMVRHEANCFAPCPVCGEEINCGFADITNQWSGLSLRISFMNLHFLSQGSFAVSATERVDPLRLEAMLRPSVLMVAEGGQLTLRWPSRAGYRYQVFSAPDLSGPWTPGSVWQGDGTELVVPQAIPSGAGRRFYRVAVLEGSRAGSP